MICYDYEDCNKAVLKNKKEIVMKIKDKIDEAVKMLIRAIEKEKEKNKEVIEAVEVLNSVFKKEKIESTIDQIYADLAACKFDNALKIKMGIDNTISYMNYHTGAFWQHSRLSCRVAALYLILTKYSKKYRGESIDDRLAFITKIICHVLIIGDTNSNFRIHK
jgi:Zn-dependent oligopeptidase